MPSMDFQSKITVARPFNRPKEDLDTRELFRLQTAAESDRGRIINSAAIRRLQQKTQVFPLERNAAVRSRLTHSLEVQQVGRYICQRIVQMMRENEVKDHGFIELERVAESLVEMACLMHDIGNPPFGHFGEKAIGDWFKQYLTHPGFAEFDPALRTDLQNFEGNAQAIRLIFSLLELNLTYTQAACILKYTRPAGEPKPDKSHPQSYLMKKPGFYHSERKQVTALQTHLHMQVGCRHPLSYIMEAADDISYCYADIEDAVEKKILTVPQLLECLKEAFEENGGDLLAEDFKAFGKRQSFTSLLDKACGKFDKESIDKSNRFFVDLRVSLNHILVNHAAERFIDNLQSVYDGTFNSALLEDDSPVHKLTEAFKSVALAHVFSNKEVELQELRGYTIIQGLLSYYQPLLALSAQDFMGLLEKEGSTMRRYSREARMANKLPGKHRRAYKKAVEADPDNRQTEFYFRCRLMQDFVSGMTDQFALDEYQQLVAVG